MRTYKRYFDNIKQQKAFYQNFKHFKSEKYQNDILIKNLALLETHSYRLEIIDENQISHFKTIETYLKNLQSHISISDSVKICSIILQNFKNKNFKELTELKMNDILEKINLYLKPKYEERFILYHETNIKVLIQFYFYIEGNKILKFNSKNKISNIIRWLKNNSELLNLEKLEILEFLEFLTFQEKRYITENLITKYKNLIYISKNKFTDSNINFIFNNKYEFFKFDSFVICIKNNIEIIKFK